MKSLICSDASGCPLRLTGSDSLPRGGSAEADIVEGGSFFPADLKTCSEEIKIAVRLRNGFLLLVLGSVISTAIIAFSPQEPQPAAKKKAKKTGISVAPGLSGAPLEFDVQHPEGFLGIGDPGVGKLSVQNSRITYKETFGNEAYSFRISCEEFEAHASYSTNTLNIYKQTGVALRADGVHYDLFEARVDLYKSILDACIDAEITSDATGGGRAAIYERIKAVVTTDAAPDRTRTKKGKKKAAPVRLGRLYGPGPTQTAWAGETRG